MLFVTLLALLLLGPIVWTVVQAVRHPTYQLPEHEDGLEAAAMIQSMKDLGDMRTGGRGL